MAGKKNIFFLFFLLLWCAVSLCPQNASDAASGKEPRLGVWITVFTPEKVLFSKASADRLIGRCRTSGIDHIYLQVYRADKAYYDSDITDRSAYEKMLKEAGGDNIKYLIREAHKSGIKVYAWLNLLSISQNSGANILKKYGNQVLTRDQHGRTSLRKGDKDKLDKYYIRENQLFLEPGDERVRSYLASIAAEIMKKYPDLDGLHLDYVRYPAVVPFSPGSRFISHGLGYGYVKTNLDNFKKNTGLNARTMEGSRDNYRKWDDWHRDQVTTLVKDISGRVKALSPSAEISCTIVPSIERTHLVTFQDWTEWLREGYVDYVTVMNYTDDTKLLELNSGSMLLPEVEEKVYIGVGAYLLKKKTAVLKEQLSYLIELSPAGIVIFSYDDIADNEELQVFLEKNFKG